MTYSTVQGVPCSTAVVHPWISHPPSVSRKNTTSKPLLAPRCCHAASGGKDANDTASTFPPPEEEVTTAVVIARAESPVFPVAGGQSRAFKGGRRCPRASSRQARWRARAPCHARTSGSPPRPYAC